DDGDEERPEGSYRDQGNAARQNAPREPKEGALARQGPRERFIGEQPADLAEQTRPETSTLCGPNTCPPPVDHLVRLPPLPASVERQHLPTPAPELERTACLLERQRSQHLLDQELVRIANRNELHRWTILAWPAAAQIRPGRPTSPGVGLAPPRRLERARSSTG